MTECDELLKKAWEGEVLGRSFFGGLADAMPADRPVWSMMRTIEDVTARLIAPFCVAKGIEIDEAAQDANGRTAASGAAGSTRDEILRGGLVVVAQYLTIYEALTEQLPTDERWLGHELVAHEQALAALMEGTLDGREDAARAATDYLAGHGVEAVTS